MGSPHECEGRSRQEWPTMMLRHGARALAPRVADLSFLNSSDEIYSDYILPDYSIISTDPEVKLGVGREHEFGTTYIDKWQMNDADDTNYKVMRSEADEPLSDVWIVKDTAWSTQPTGLNAILARKLNQIGFNVLIKGPEINSSIPMSQSAYNTHLLLDEYHDLGVMNTDAVAFDGYSRGAMIGMGTMSYAPWFERGVVYANHTDPCVALPIKVLPMDFETAKKAVTLPYNLAILGLSAVKGVLNHGEEMLETIDLSVEGAKQFYRTGKPLMNGEAGMMATQVPPEIVGTVAFFTGCTVNDRSTYKKIFDKNNPNIRVVSPGGGHGEGIEERVMMHVVNRFARVGRQLAEQRRPDEFDLGYVLHGREEALAA